MAHIRSAFQHLLVFIFALIIFFAQGTSFVFHLWDHSADKRDSLFNAWTLAWNTHAILTPGTALWDAPIFYPVKNTLAFSEAQFSNLWITLPIQYLTGNSVFAANMLALVSFVLGMYCVFLLVRELTGSYWAGIIAGIIFSFNPYRWLQLPRLQLLPFFWAPVALLYANRFLKDLQSRNFIWMLLTLWVQYYASIYLGTFLLTLLLTLLVFNLALERSKKDRWIFWTDRRIRRMFFWGAGCSVMALLPLGWPYLEVNRIWSVVREISENTMYSVEPLSLLAPPTGSFKHYTWLIKMTHGLRTGECAIFLGFSPWVLAVSGICLAKYRKVPPERIAVIRRYAWTALVMGIFTLGPYLIFFNKNTRIPLPHQIIYYLVPGVQAMRAPARFVIPLLLCLSVLGGYATAYFLSRIKQWPAVKRTVVLLLAGAFFSLDYALVEQGEPVEVGEQIPPVYAYLAKRQEQKPLLELPMGQWESFQYSYYQTTHWQPSIGGISGWTPPHMDRFLNQLTNCPSPDCFSAIYHSPTAIFIVHLDRYPEAMRPRWENADLTPYKFTFSGRVGNALVWERPRGFANSTAKLVAAPDDRSLFVFERKKGILVRLHLASSETGKPWVNFGQPPARIGASLDDVDGKPLKRIKGSLYLPEFIAAEKTERVMVAIPQKIPATTGRITLEGPLLASHTLDYSKAQWLNGKNTSISKSNGLSADLEKLIGPVDGQALLPGETTSVEADILNTGKSYWLESNYGDMKGPVSLGALWFHKKDINTCQIPSMSAVREERIHIPYIVSPNDRIMLRGNIQAPMEKGDYVLMLGMVSDGVAWFSNVGNSFLTCLNISVDEHRH